MDNYKSNDNLNTAYDDAYHTLLNDCPQLIIPVVNETFHENYDVNEIVERTNATYYINKQEGGQLQRIADSNVKIRNRTYHIECQSTSDGSMIMRVFEYDAQAALQEAELEKNVLTVKFPHAAVLYLRHNSNTPNYLIIRVQVPGSECSYEVPVIKAQQYTVEELFEKNLFFLIPFHIFAYEKSFKLYEENQEKLKELRLIYQGIVERLEECTKAGEITEYTKKTVITMAQKVLQKIAMKYANVREGVGDVMGGRVLDYEAKDILNQGKAMGKAEGKAEDVLVILQELGTLSDELKERIMTEKDLGRLKRWIKLAARADTVNDFVNKMEE